MISRKILQPFFKIPSVVLNFALWRDFFIFLYPNIPQLRSNCFKANFCVNKGGLGFGIERREAILLGAIFCKRLKEVRC